MASKAQLRPNEKAIDSTVFEEGGPVITVGREKDKRFRKGKASH